VYAEAYRQGHADGSREGWESGNEDGLREGWKQGYEEGRHAALEEAETSARQYAEAGARIAQAIQSASEHCARALEAGAIEIAHAAILRIAGSSAGNREFVVGIVRQLIEELPERKLLSIRLAPDDFALLQQQSAELACHAGLLQADERVGLGGCIIDTDAGSLDGRLETQLAELRETLLSAHRTREETA
jgi:flagellar assembly protein FliH